MRILILLISLIYSLLASNKIENNYIPLENNFTKIEKEYISTNTVTLGMMAEYYPFSFEDNGRISGFSYDYIQLIIKKSGLKIDIEMNSWSKILNKFENKQIDLIDVISYIPNREVFTNFSPAYFEIPNVIFGRKGEINDYKGFESLKGKKVGITKGIYYANDLKALNLFELVEFESTKEKIKALAHEKVDVIFNNLISGQKYIKQSAYSNIKIVDEIDSTIVKKEDLRIGVSKGNDVLFSIINKSIAAITKEEIEILNNKWFAAKLELETTKNNISFTDEEKEYLKEKKQINMCIDPEWMPFEKNDNGKHIGMSADYFKIFEESLSIPIRMIPTSTWSQSIELAQKRECDIFSLVMQTPQRLKYLDFSQVYLKTPLVIATKNNALFITEITELKDKKVGLIKGYPHTELLKEKYPYMNFIEVTNIKEGLDNVYSEELFAFIGGLTTIGFELQSNYIGQLKVAGKTDESFALSVGIRNDEPILKAIFNKAISNVTEQEHQEILNKWISISYQEGVSYETILKYVTAFLIPMLVLILVYRQYLLKDLNKKLNEKVKIEIEKNIQKNKILSEQSKMAAMGEMIGNIAHQWRQPLSVISTASTGTRIQKEMNSLSDEQLYLALNAINDSAQYLSSTIDDFRGFFNPHNNKISEFNIAYAFNKTLNLVKAQFVSKDIDIIQDIEEFKISSIENELIQVLINILNNARDALMQIENERKLIFISTYNKDDILYIEIKDNAGGIKEDIMDRIFEPYFTTKHKSLGTGIGLYMSKEIVEKHLNGKLHALNEHYNFEDTGYIGAKFTIEISKNSVSII